MIAVSNAMQKFPLLYKYPSPTQDTIININNTILENPDFYLQVLHLMNKMDLRAPFRRAKRQNRILNKVSTYLMMETSND
jgi:hypothetical protein